jgi:hypothetical protein
MWAGLRREEGRLDWRHVPVWLAGAAVVVVPSLTETFGLAALVVMSVGTLVLACVRRQHPRTFRHRGRDRRPEQRAGGTVASRSDDHQ